MVMAIFFEVSRVGSVPIAYLILLHILTTTLGVVLSAAVSRLCTTTTPVSILYPFQPLCYVAVISNRAMIADIGEFGISKLTAERPALWFCCRATSSILRHHWISPNATGRNAHCNPDLTESCQRAITFRETPFTWCDVANNVAIKAERAGVVYVVVQNPKKNKWPRPNPISSVPCPDDGLWRARFPRSARGKP
ncbi:hypothetical protein F4679DRAFT_484564 [Xylaria curta]|nr:hypothetical protein F4679DRAFT_484564 [Xylaria curta]